MLVIPDLYADAGGVTVSHFERLMNMSNGRLPWKYTYEGSQATTSSVSHTTVTWPSHGPMSLSCVCVCCVYAESVQHSLV